MQLYFLINSTEYAAAYLQRRICEEKQLRENIEEMEKELERYESIEDLCRVYSQLKKQVKQLKIILNINDNSDSDDSVVEVLY